MANDEADDRLGDRGRGESRPETGDRPADAEGARSDDGGAWAAADGASPTDPTDESDEFDNIVLDESFVRGGAYEAPARTRLAIARYGDQQTSWRHAGGLTARDGDANDVNRRGARREPGWWARRRSARNHRDTRADAASPIRRPARAWSLPASVKSRLPLIAAIVVVAAAAYLEFR